MPGPAAPISPWYASNRFAYAAVGVLLLLHFGLANAGTWNKCGTFDEDSHIGNAYSFVETDDYRMFPVAMFQYRWMTLPLRLAGIKAPAVEQPMWGQSNNWEYARRLLYESGNDSWFILHTTRMMTSLWSVVIGLIVFFWSRSLFGTAGAFISLALYLFNPTALAHAASATTDMCASLAFTAAIASLWHVLNRVSPGRLLLSGVVWGCAFGAKFSLLLLIPIGVLMVLVRIISGEPTEVSGGLLFKRGAIAVGRLPRAAIYLGITLVHVLVIWCVIWTLFGFQFSMFGDFPNDPKQIYTGSFETLQSQTGAAAEFIGFAREMQLLPEAYLYNFADTLRTTSIRSSFLNGRYGTHGFPSFFLYCMLYKTPLSVFVIGALAIAAIFPLAHYRSRLLGGQTLRVAWQGFYRTAPLWCLLAVYWYTSISRGINIGIRHILPTFPATFILAGVAGLWLSRFATAKSNAQATPQPDAETNADAAPNPAADPGTPLDSISPQLQMVLRYAVFACLGWLAGDTLTSFPNYLAYFNSTAGGTENGYHHLVDSSLDWGQELPNLGKWLDENIRNLKNPPKVYCSYFGGSPPNKYGVDGNWLPGFFPIEQLEPNRRVRAVNNFDAGVYCISATSLQCVYNSPFPGPWRVDYEQNYHALSNLIQSYMRNLKNPQVLEEELKKSGLPHWDVAIRLFDVIRFGRLCAHLRYRQPDAMINGAILIFKLSNEDIQRIMMNPPSEMYPPPEKPEDNVPY